MRPFQKAFDQPEFIHHLQGQGMQVVAAKIADEVRMLPQHTDVDADMSRQFPSIIPAGSAVKHDLLMNAKFFTDSSSMQTHLLYLQRLLILYLHNYNMRDDFASEGVCTMSSISATGASTYNALASLLTPAPSTSDSPPQTAASTNSNIATPSTDPIDTVDLSDRAKRILARATFEQTAADKLSAVLQSLDDPDGKPTASKPSSDKGTSLFDKLSGRAQDSRNDTAWTAGARAGDASISDAEFTAKYKDSLLVGLTGFPADKQQALQAAINNGTLKFQLGSDVEGYNTRTVVTYTVGPGGGQGMSTSGYRAATGAAKEAIDAGNAYGFWTEDRGDVYVTW